MLDFRSEMPRILRLPQPVGEGSDDGERGGVGGAGLRNASGAGEEITTTLEPEFTTLAERGEGFEAGEGGCGHRGTLFEFEGAQVQDKRRADPDDRGVERGNGGGGGILKSGQFEKKLRPGVSDEHQGGFEVGPCGGAITERELRARTQNTRLGVGRIRGKRRGELIACGAILVLGEGERAARAGETGKDRIDFGSAEEVGFGGDPVRVFRVKFAAAEQQAGIVRRGGDQRIEMLEGRLDLRMTPSAAREQEPAGSEAGTGHARNEGGASGPGQHPA